MDDQCIILVIYFLLLEFRDVCFRFLLNILTNIIMIIVVVGNASLISKVLFLQFSQYSRFSKRTKSPVTTHT